MISVVYIKVFRHILKTATSVNIIQSLLPTWQIQWWNNIFNNVISYSLWNVLQVSNQIIWLIIHTWTVQIIEYRNTQTCPQEANMIVHCECVHCQLWYVFPNSREPWSKCVCVCVCTIWLCHWTYIWQHPLISPSIPSCDYNGQEYNYESHLMHVYM